MTIPQVEEMTVSLLKTKLRVPAVRVDLVSRPRLIERLDAGLGGERGGFARRLTLISAPAGSGKTTLLAEWVTHLQNPAAWLSLDERDNDESRFWAYLIGALQTVHSDLGQAALQLLEALQQLASQAILTSLLNEIAALSQGFVLVLDDYHVISNQTIHEGIAFLLEHLPQRMHVAISTRADPPLPTHRLRARGQMTELRSEDLRFSADEAAAFLNATMGLDLAPGDVKMLQARTEGWIVGLQLAALSLEGRADTREFIKAFGGGHHYVLEYLIEEVVRRQPEPVQRFLMQTSILDRLCGPLCNALTGRSDGAAMLARLWRRNLFILPLDDEHHWYRYHDMFADLLGNLMRTEWPPESIRELHLRACEWHERNGLTAEAVSHALAAGDFERTAQLIERNSLAMVTRGELSTLLRWIDALPEELAQNRPWLCIHQAWPLTFAGKTEAVERLLQQVEGRVTPDEPTPEGEELLGNVAAMRAMLAVMRGDMHQAIELAHRADDWLPADNLLPRNIIPYTLASAYCAEGDLVGARQALIDELNIGRAADNLWTVVRSLCDLADVRIIQGQLRRAADLCQQALQLAEDRGARQFGTVGYALVKLGDVLYERGDLVAAREHAREGVELMQAWQQPFEMASGYTVLAKILQAQNDTQGALEALQKAERIQAQHPSYAKVNSMVDLCRIRLCLDQRGPEEAARQARETRLGETGPLIFREQEQVALAQVRVAQGRWDEAHRLLAQLADDAEAGGRLGRLIQILVLRAVAWQQQGDVGRALAALEKALTIGEPEGYVRVFVEPGEPMAALLQRVTARRTAPDYVSRLLVALKAKEKEVEAAPSSPSTSGLVETLTRRETEVLQLLGKGYSNQQIAEALVVTLNTVKKHTTNVYGKLGVHSRTQAVVRAQELGLL
jgi:LuxR family maltose regulon positive regulatory protein